MRSFRHLLIVALFLPFAPFAYCDDVNLDDYILFGVNGSTNELIRYDFADASYQALGAIHFADSTTLTGIEGMAYIPKNLNFFGFWKDPSSAESRLIYINSQTAQATLVGNSMGPGQVTAATVAIMDVDENGDLVLGADGDHDKGHGNDCDGVDEDNPGNSNGVSEQGMGHGAHSGCAVETDPDDETPNTDVQKLHVFAIQKVEAVEDATVDFTIDGGHVVPNEQFAAKATVLGAAITAGGTYDVPVTVRIKVGTTTFEPFGDFTKPVNGTVNDDDNPREYVLGDTYPAGTEITIEGRSWIKKKSWYNGNSNNHWISYMTVDSDDNSPYVLTLKNGDAVPDIEPFMNQTEIVDFIRDYVDTDTNTVVLDENQVIYLFELGTTNLYSSAADFQDLVVLVTLAHDPSELAENDDDDDAAAPAARLVRVNTLTGALEQIMTLDREYDGLAASPTSRFYATLGSEIYQLDPIDQTETLRGTLAASDMKGLEFAGATMCGFTVIGNELIPIDMYGSALDDPFSIGTTNLRTITFMRTADEPNTLAAAYD